MKTPLSLSRILRAAWSGAGWGISLALLYGLAFGAYAVLRSTGATLEAGLPAGLSLLTLFGNLYSILVSVIVFVLLFGLLAALLEALAMAAILPLAGRFPGRGVWVGLGVAAIITALFELLLNGLTGLGRAILWGSGYWLWQGLPLLIFIAFNTWLGSRVTGQPRAKPAAQPV